MFPLDFPLEILNRHGDKGEWVLDPFSGRGTTNLASRIVGLPSIGIDSNPVANALTSSKIVNTSPQRIIRAAINILKNNKTNISIPQGEFWSLCFHEEVLKKLCILRENLINNCQSDTRKALRGIILGALHGPTPKTKDSYFSNQCTRTYAPKPNYAVKFWKKKKLFPRKVDVTDIIRERAERYYSRIGNYFGYAILGDSREKSIFDKICKKNIIKWVITSPPYYGMRTYIPDQWLRQWFLGGSTHVKYSNKNQLTHNSPEEFAKNLRKVWRNISIVASDAARLIIRFGGINDRKADPLKIIKSSLCYSGWKIQMILPAGTASKGKRQADHFSKYLSSAKDEFDIWALKNT
jgi:hypothetical protein